MIKKSIFSNYFKIVMIGISIIIAFLGLGIYGYMHFEGMTVAEALENSVAFLSRRHRPMELFTNEGKIFSGIYAIFSRIAFFVAVILIAFPVISKFICKINATMKAKM